MSFQVNVTSLTQPVQIIIDGIANITISPIHDMEVNDMEDDDIDNGLDDVNEGLMVSGNDFYLFWKSLTTTEKRDYLDRDIEQYMAK